MWWRKRNGLLLVACLAAGAAAAAHVAIVHGETGVPLAERPFALALARHAERWCRDAGLEAVVGGDTRLPDLLAAARVTMLIQFSAAEPSHLAALRAYVQGGGRLIVCYSTSAPLAALMGVSLGGYVKGATDGRWSCMRFEESRPQGVPAAVAQTSPNLFLARPMAGQSQVLAWWEDRRGRRMPEPAWLTSRYGYWMTHVLLADGDTAAKGQLLLALAASCDPSLWQVAAARKLAAARVAGPLHAPADIAPLARRVADRGRRELLLIAAREATELEQVAQQDLAAGRGCMAWTRGEQLRRKMALAYGLMQSPRPGELRAVWDHSGMGLYPGDWPRTCRTLKEAGFSDLYVCAGGMGFAHYRSGVLPPSRIYLEQGDQLAACTAAARTVGLRIHAWIFCFTTENATEERLAIFRNRGLLLTGEEGRERRWLDPSAVEVRATLVRAAVELAGRYAVDGVHLDFVRYPDFTGSLGLGVRARFEADLGQRCAGWPDDVKKGVRRTEFLRWRCDQITDFVAQVRTALRRDTPGKMLTAAVYGKYPSCADAVGQDWEAWVRQGYVDYLLPMDYTEDLTKFRELIAAQSRTRWLRRRMLPGLGVTAAESRLDAAQVVDQIAAVREAGCPGFALFDLDTYLEREILPVLKVGMTAQ